jgi:spore germination protein
VRRAAARPGEAREEARAALGRVARRVGLRGWRAGAAAAATGAAVLVVAGIVLGGRGPRRLMPGPGNAQPQLIGFYENAGGALNPSSLPSVKAHAAELNTVLAFWYSVDGTGSIQAHGPDAAVTSWVRAHGMRMGILINNVAGSAGSNSAMLTDRRARAAAIANIVRLVRADGYQEVNIDFEDLKPDVAGALVTFMRMLHAALPAGVTLSEDVFPRLGVPTSMNGAYDYARLAKYADYLVVMLYDKHSSGGPPGPVSPWPWVTENMNWLVHTARVPADRLVLAAGVYGYDWPQGSTAATEIPLTQVVSLEQAHGVTPRTDPSSQNPHFTYTAADGTTHVVWFQDEAMLVQRLRLAETMGLRGVAIWALGQETPAVWRGIEETWGSKP